MTHDSGLVEGVLDGAFDQLLGLVLVQGLDGDLSFAVEGDVKLEVERLRLQTLLAALHSIWPQVSASTSASFSRSTCPADVRRIPRLVKPS